MSRNQYTAWPKSPIAWRRGDTLCISVVFTWQFSKAVIMAHTHHVQTGGNVEIGGPAVKLLEPKGEMPWLTFQKKRPTDDRGPVNVVQRMNPLATFTTRGCPNSCSFCAVPRIEGELKEIRRFKPGPIICDSNLLACSKAHFRRVIRMLEDFDWCDFNQGLDCMRFTSWHAGEIAKIKKPKVRFAFDHVAVEPKLVSAIEKARQAGIPNRQLGVYVLIGHNDTPANALYRLERVRELKIRPNPMRYQPLDSVKKNAFVGSGWTERKLRDMMRYYAGLRWFGKIPFSEYRNTSMKEHKE